MTFDKLFTNTKASEGQKKVQEYYDKVKNAKKFTFYIYIYEGVLIDNQITIELEEPYDMEYDIVKGNLIDLFVFLDDAYEGTDIKETHKLDMRTYYDDLNEMGNLIARLKGWKIVDR